jgi:hypothetical protein
MTKMPGDFGLGWVEGLRARRRRIPYGGSSYRAYATRRGGRAQRVGRVWPFVLRDVNRDA